MKKEFRMLFWGGGGGLSDILFGSTDKTLGTEYDIYLSCALIVDHVTLLAIFIMKS